MEFLKCIDRGIAAFVTSPMPARVLPWLSRSLLGLIFVVAGFGKLGAGYAGSAAYMASAGVPESLLPLVILLELGGGLALIAGFQTRAVALLLAVFCMLAALLFHLDFTQKMQQIMFMKNFAIAGGLLGLMVSGAGPYSVDGRWLSAADQAAARR